MTIYSYTGTLTGSGTFNGPGFTEQESQSDAETADLTIDSSGNFTGTVDQVITTTVTVNIPGVPPTTSTSTYDSGPQPVSGNVNTPYTTVVSEGGNTVTTIWTFSPGPAYSTITVNGIDSYNSGGISGSFDFGGTLTTAPPLSTILSAAQQNFGNGNYVYSYDATDGTKFPGDGTKAAIDKNGNIGLGIDCSHMVWETLLMDGYNIPYLNTNSIMNFYDANGNLVNINSFTPPTLTADGAQYFTSVSPSELQAGDIIIFDPEAPGSAKDKPPGHMGIIADYNPLTGTGHFFGSQTSTGPALTSFSTYTGTFGGSHQIAGYLAPNSSTYDPNGAAQKLAPITSQADQALVEVQDLRAIPDLLSEVDPEDPNLTPTQEDTSDPTEGVISNVSSPSSALPAVSGTEAAPSTASGSALTTFTFTVTFPWDLVDPGWTETVSITNGVVTGVTGATVTGGGDQIVMSGETASGTTILTGGEQTVQGGGTASGTTVDSGGTLNVLSGGTAVVPVISGGSVELSAGSNVSGAITFSGSGGTLRIDGTNMPTAVILGFRPGDTLDLTSISFEITGSITLKAGNVLEVKENGNSYDFNLDPSQSLAGWDLKLSSDGATGTNIRLGGQRDDFNFDRTSDILFRNDGSGDTWVEAMSNGAAARWNQIGGSSTSFTAVGVGDFYGTGTSDVLFRNNSNGDTWVEIISNGASAGWQQIGGSDTHYNLVGIGDFYGDGTDDVLFRNNSSGDTWIEAISNGMFNGWHQIGGSDTHYSVVGVGDFYGNGTDDILFRNNSTGDTWVEAISNGAYAGWQQIGGSDTHYSVVGVGDFFGNGTDDILFRNNSTGDTWIEVINNGASVSWNPIGGSDTHYAAVAVGDYLGDGTDDVLFRNNLTGDTWFEAISNGASAGWNQVGSSNTSYTVAPSISAAAPSTSSVSNPSGFTVFNGEVLFNGTDASGLQGLWVSNGTAAGTYELTGVAGAYSGTGGLDPMDLTVFNGKVLFRGRDTSGNYGLWVTNGTAAGTFELTNIGGADSNGILPQAMTPFNGEVLFDGEDMSGLQGLWVSNGTAAGTHELTGIIGANTSTYGLSPSDLTVLNGEVLFAGQENMGNDHIGLWVTNGTAAGTHELTGIIGANTGMYGLDPRFVVAFNNEVLFNGIDPSGGNGLWVSNGTAAGTHELTGISGAGSSGPAPYDLTVFNGKVLFSSDAPDYGGLWVTDGTVGGTSELTGISGAHSGGLNLNDLTVFNNEVLFDGFDASDNKNLWVTNGTTGGTHELTGIGNVYSGGLFAGIISAGFAVFNNEVLFEGRDASGLYGLWATNGTAVGTFEVR